MKYLGLDLGTKTLGIAMSDKTGTIATSYKVLKHNDNYQILINQLKDIINDYKIDIIVLGFPKNMDNTIGPRALKTIKFKELIEMKLNIKVLLQDERLTTKQAQDTLILYDISRKKRKGIVDKLAATIILQSFLDTRKE
ncbi:MAG: Holliday junction resolvase RuvX [Tenericutes bacterium]|jgi:putative Holliday junction resolvase|nr:Holliday junction resolvase RuvX [Mycoplasmatota bacterium]